MSYLMRKAPDDERIWEVGYFKPNGEWVTIITRLGYGAAAQEVHFLNGGDLPAE